MAWELRRTQPYYYRSIRVNGRVVKQYVGKGMIADEFARLQREKQQLLQARRRSVREFGEQLQHYERILKPFWTVSDALFKRAFEAAGYHYHRGEWRRRQSCR